MKKNFKLKKTSLIPKDVQSSICDLIRFKFMKVSYMKFKMKIIITNENGHKLEYSFGKSCTLDLKNKHERTFCKFYLMNKFYNLDIDLNKKYKNCHLGIEYVIITPNQHFQFINKYLPNFKHKYVPKLNDINEKVGQTSWYLEVPIQNLNSNNYLEHLEWIIYLNKYIKNYDYLNIHSKVWLHNNSNRIMTFPVTDKVILDLNNKKDIEAYFNHIRVILDKNKFHPPLEVYDLKVKPQEVLINYRKSNYTEYMAYHIYRNMENNIINTKKNIFKHNEFTYKI